MRVRHVTAALALCVLLTAPVSAQRVYSEQEIRTAGGILPSRQACPELDYPKELARAGVSGRVVFQFVVSTDGFVEPASIETIEATHPDFERSLHIMLLNCRFSPGKLSGDGASVPVQMRYGMNFGVRGPQREPVPPADVATIDFKRIFDVNETMDGRPVLTARPKYMDCPKYDPQERTARARIADRYERPERIEYVPTKVEALLELVIGVDGVPEKKLSKVLETSDRQVNKTLLQWVQSCRFTSGRIGERRVRVRIEFPVTFTFTRS